MLFTYDPSVHDYSEEQPELVCIGHDHYVFGNSREIAEYTEKREKNVPLKPVTVLTPEQMEEYERNQEAAPMAEPILETPLHDTGSPWYSFGSFFLPVFGAIAASIFKEHKHFRNYKACKKGAVVGFSILGGIIAVFGIGLLLAALL